MFSVNTCIEDLFQCLNFCVEISYLYNVKMFNLNYRIVSTMSGSVLD